MVFSINLVLAVSVMLSFTTSDAKKYRHLFEEIILENVPYSPQQERLEKARMVLAIIGSDLSAASDINRQCLIGSCGYENVLSYLKNHEDSTLYWSALACFKYGAGCEVNSFWLEWGSWSECSTKCGQGQKTRWRHCHTSTWGDAGCEGAYAEAANCNGTNKYQCMPSPSQPDNWGAWEKWTRCHLTCGSDGRVQRKRRCEPSGYSMYCVGNDTETRQCTNVPDCPAPGGWSKWSKWWNNVAKTCHYSVNTRVRSCSKPSTTRGGRRCEGMAVEFTKSLGKKCTYLPSGMIVGLTPSTGLIYKNHPSWPFLSVVLKFRPASSEGVIFRHRKRIRRSKKVTVTRGGSPHHIDVDEDHVTISLVDFELQVSLIVNGSDPVVINAGRAKTLQWNVVRLLIVSDVISVRLNDGQNMRASLQDSPNRPDFTFVTHDRDDERYWANLYDRKNDVEHPDAPELSVVRNIRAILSNFEGSISLGKDGKDEGFHGYISLLLINFERYEFRTPSGSRQGSYRNPVRSNADPFQDVDYDQHEEMQLPHFDGKKRLHVPLAMKWWNDAFTQVNFTNMKENSFTANDAAHIRMIFKPEVADAVLIWNQGKTDLASQWKVVMEDAVRVKLIATRQGGEVHVVTSTDELKIGKWNLLDILLFRDGVVQFRLNSDETKVGRVPPLTVKSQPGPYIVVGGPRKEENMAAVVLMTGHFDRIDSAVIISSVSKAVQQLKETDDNSGIYVFGQFYKSPSNPEEGRKSGFQGFIYSFQQNGVEFVVHGKNMSNPWGMPLSIFMNEPVTHEFWYFKPVYQDDSYKPKPGFFTRLLRLIRLKSQFRPSDDVSVADIRKGGNVREVACVVPVSPDALEAPDIIWYKDDMPISDGYRHLIRNVLSSTSLRSSVFLLPLADGSREHSGIYSCVLVDQGDLRLFVNHVVAVISNNIADPQSYFMSVIAFIRQRTGASEIAAMFIAAAVSIGTTFTLVIICLFQRWWTRTFSRRKRKRRRKNEVKILISDDEKEMSIVEEEDYNDVDFKDDRTRYRNDEDNLEPADNLEERIDDTEIDDLEETDDFEDMDALMHDDDLNEDDTVEIEDEFEDDDDWSDDEYQALLPRSSGKQVTKASKVLLSRNLKPHPRSSCRSNDDVAARLISSDSDVSIQEADLYGDGLFEY